MFNSDLLHMLHYLLKYKNRSIYHISFLLLVLLRHSLIIYKDVSFSSPWDSHQLSVPPFIPRPWCGFVAESSELDIWCVCVKHWTLLWTLVERLRQWRLPWFACLSFNLWSEPKQLKLTCALFLSHFQVNPCYETLRKHSYFSCCSPKVSLKKKEKKFVIYLFVHM